MFSGLSGAANSPFRIASHLGGEITVRVHVAGFGAGAVLPPQPPGEITPDAGQLELERHAPTVEVTDNELLDYLGKLNELSKHLQQSALEWSKENPGLAWFLLLVVSPLIIQAINALFE